jgi:hypothetical protein
MRLFIHYHACYCPHNLLSYTQSNYLMGRRIPSFRIAAVEEQKEWKPFTKL